MPSSSAAHAALNEQLAASLSATIYADIPGADPDHSPQILEGDPVLLAVFDQVRQLWGVRKATAEDVQAEQAESAPAAPAAEPETEEPHHTSRAARST